MTIMKATILAEDTSILVCFKPPGIAVQSARLGEADMVSELKTTWAGGIPIWVWCTGWISLFAESLFCKRRRRLQS